MSSYVAIGLALLLSVGGCYGEGSNAKANPLEDNVPTPTESLTPEPWITPLPWTEVHRVTSPNGQFDAVVVTRPDTGPPYHLTGDPTDLYLVPHGEPAEREPSFPPYPSSLNRTREHRKQIPFHSYDAKDVVVGWKDDSTVLLGAREASVYKMEKSHEVVSGELKRSIAIEYFIEWDAFGRKAGPKYPR